MSYRLVVWDFDGTLADSLVASVASFNRIAPAMALRRILKAERISPGEVLYVGDEVRDVEASKKARVTVAAVTWGFHAESLLRDNGADHVVTEPRQLLELVTPALAAG